MTSAGEPAPRIEGSTAATLRVIVVTYFPGEHLDTFLETLETATTTAPTVVLADNGSTDGSIERAATRPGVEVLRTGANLGYGGAANVGARAASEDWLLVANPDIVWTPGALDVLLGAADRWTDAGVLGPAILTPQGDLYPSARSFPSLSRGIGHALLGWIWSGNPWTRSYRRESGVPVEGPTGWLSGSCMLVRRTAFEAVGGFDRRFFMYFEDLDLCRRLAEAGWSSVFVPSAVVEHVGGHVASAPKHSTRMLLAHHRSAYRYLGAQYAGPRWAPVRVVLAAGLAARFVLSLAVRRVREGARPNRDASVLAVTRPPSQADPPT
jgi:N-acetylglucosaminyl-diphospho-decaprenol L-rhamnosyltransferase